MKTWTLDRKGITEILQRVIELENKVAILEQEKEWQSNLIKERLDRAIEQLEPQLLDKCYCRVYEKDFLVKLLEKTEEE